MPSPGMCIRILHSGGSLLSRLQARAQREILGKFKLNGLEKVAMLFHCNRGVNGVWLQVLPGCPEIVASRLFCLIAPLPCWLEEDMLAGPLESATSPTWRLLLALGWSGPVWGFRASWHHSY